MIMSPLKTDGDAPYSLNKQNLDNDFDSDLYDAWIISKKNSDKESILGNENVFQQFMIEELAVYKIKGVAT